MKILAVKLILVITMVLSALSLSYSQSLIKDIIKNQVSTKQSDLLDFDYYFFEGNSLKDVRDYSTKIDIPTPGEVKQLDENRFLIKNKNGISYYQDEKFISSISISRPDWLSPDWQREIFLKDNDLWIREINWSSGGFANEIRLTETGIFGTTSWYIHDWYKDKVIISIGNETYLFNLLSKEFKKISIKYNNTVLPIWTSAKGRFFGWGLEYFDFETEKKYQINNNKFKNFAQITLSTRSPLKIDGFTLSFQLTGFESTVDPRPKDYLVVCDLRYPDSPEIIQINPEVSNGVPGIGSLILKDLPWREPHFTKSMIQTIRGSASRAFSQDRQKLCFTTRFQPGSFFVHDFLTDKDIMVESDLSKTLVSTSRSISNRDLFFGWISNTTLIYSKNEGIMDQGTFFYDLKNGQKKKLTPFLIQELVILEGPGEVLFRANNKLFQCNSDGSGFEVINNKATQRISYFLK